MCVYTTCVCNTQKYTKRSLDDLKLELHKIVSHHVDFG